MTVAVEVPHGDRRGAVDDFARAERKCRGRAEGAASIAQQDIDRVVALVGDREIRVAVAIEVCDGSPTGSEPV
jgi:hypothetical protein